MDDLFGDDSDAASDDESTLATGPPPPHRGGPYLTPLPPVRPGQVGTPLVEYFPAHAEYLVYLSDAMELREDLADVGGGRGYVAARDVEPGELLMVERAVIERCDVDREHVLEDAAEQLLGMSEIDPDLKASLDRLHPAADSIDGEYDGIVRLALAWRFNAFESGLYLHKSLFNDSENAPATQLLVGELSEVWATSAISRGDAVTLHYVYPRDCTAAKREKYLVAHHGFWDGAPAFDSNAADEAFEAALDRVEENYDAVEAEARRAGPAGGGAGLEKQTRALLDDARAQRRAAAPYPMALQRRAHSLVARVADFMSDIGADVSPAPAAAPAAASKVAAEATPAAPDAHDLAVAELPPILARDGEALRCALLWLGALDEYSPDVATAAGIASAAYGRVSRRLPRSTIQRCLRDCPGLDLATAEADLRARAMRSAELFDSRRWLEAQSTARPEQ
ncbi:hypothetical protein M885DRAFT_336642 [Pelagophyceae sp. CCMP2097]|nr:hypothetical protein M885DRAFT_336642 [Pelagophyceae sp. CCMP2097]